MKFKKKNCSFYFDKEVIDELKKLSLHQNISISCIVETILKQHLNEKQHKND